MKKGIFDSPDLYRQKDTVAEDRFILCRGERFACFPSPIKTQTDVFLSPYQMISVSEPIFSAVKGISKMAHQL